MGGPPGLPRSTPCQDWPPPCSRSAAEAPRRWTTWRWRFAGHWSGSITTARNTGSKRSAAVGSGSPRPGVQFQLARTSRRIADHEPSCIDEKKALERAKRRLEVAQKRSKRSAMAAQASTRPSTSIAAAARCCPAGWRSRFHRALAALERMTAALDAYLAATPRRLARRRPSLLRGQIDRRERCVGQRRRRRRRRGKMSCSRRATGRTRGHAMKLGTLPPAPARWNWR